MKVIKDYPPNYEDIVEAIPSVADNKNVVFAYGDKIYAPRVKGKVRKDVRVHEEQHMRQQGDDPESWWARYLDDVEFRLSQEIDAYRKQYVYYVKKNHDVRKREDFLRGITKTLSGELYDNMITQKQALDLIVGLDIQV